MGGAFRWRTGLLARHDALSAQDQAQPFHDSRTAVDGPMGCRLGTAEKAGVRCAEFIGYVMSGFHNKTDDSDRPQP